MCQNAFGQSDCRILQSAISQEKSERPSRFFECKLTQKFPTRKYYCAPSMPKVPKTSLQYLTD